MLNPHKPKGRRVYLAGPMRGLPQFNFPAFHEAAAVLRAQGHFVFSPAERDMKEFGPDFGKDNPSGSEEQEEIARGESPGDLIRRVLLEDVKQVLCCTDVIVLLPGWEKSKGSLAEKAVAEAIGLEVTYYGQN